MADRPRFVEVANHWWDTQRGRAIAKGEPDPGPLYRDTRYGEVPPITLFDDMRDALVDRAIEDFIDAKTSAHNGGPLPLHNRPDGTPCNYAAMTKPNGQWVCTKCGAGGSANGGGQSDG